MIETDNAKFELTVKGRLKSNITGHIYDDDNIKLVARGYYKTWWEDPTGCGLGEIRHYEQEIDEDTIELDPEIYEDEYSLLSLDKDYEDNDWDVIEESLG